MTAETEGKAASSPPAIAPAGWKLVPVEPTREMLKAASERDDLHNRESYGRDASAEEHWYAMLSAAPEAIAPPNEWVGRVREALILKHREYLAKASRYKTEDAWKLSPDFMYAASLSEIVALLPPATTAETPATPPNTAPDMFWFFDDPENGGEDNIEEMLGEVAPYTPVALLAAKRLPTVWAVGLPSKEEDAFGDVRTFATKEAAETFCVERKATTTETGDA